MIKQGAVKINGEKITDVKQTICEVEAFVLQVGKRKFVRVRPS
jgi:tyrosyl-tRNA synthetase